MPRYHFRVSIHGQILEPGEWIELVGRGAALDKAYQLARALLELGDSGIPWMEGALVVESEDGEPIILPIMDALTNGRKAIHH